MWSKNVKMKIFAFTGTTKPIKEGYLLKHKSKFALFRYWNLRIRRMTRRESFENEWWRNINSLFEGNEIFENDKQNHKLIYKLFSQKIVNLSQFFKKIKEKSPEPKCIISETKESKFKKKNKNMHKKTRDWFPNPMINPCYFQLRRIEFLITRKIVFNK